jgi:membrane fusion protein (multidrug efflux system)
MIKPAMAYVPSVITEAVISQTIHTPLEALGTTKALNTIILTPNTTEKVSEILFKEGTLVRKGDILLRLNQQEEQATLDSALALLSEATEALTRAEGLRKSNNISNAAFKERKTDLLEAEARINILKSHIKDLTLVAPFDGIIGLSDISLGALVQPGDPIATLSEISSLKIDFDIPDLYLKDLKEGQTLKAFVEAYPETVLKGVIKTIDTIINPSTRTVVVRALISNEDHLLKPGMIANVVIETSPKNALLIPEKSILQEGTKSFVFLLDPKTQIVKRTSITIGNRIKDKVEVLTGLKESQHIVTEGHFKIRDGAKVSPQKPTSFPQEQKEKKALTKNETPL